MWTNITDYSYNRRQFIVGTGSVLIGALGVNSGTSVFVSEHEIPVRIVGVNPQEETVILENQGNDTVDLDGYQIDWEYRNDNDTQVTPFPDGVSIGAGEQLVVWSGFQSSEIPAVEADVTMREDVGDAPGDARINDDGDDVIALLSPSGEVVSTSDGEVQPPEPEPSENGDDDDEGGEDDDSGEGEEEETDRGSEEGEEETGEGDDEDDHGEKEEKAKEETDDDAEETADEDDC